MAKASTSMSADAKELPNETTRRAMDDAENDENMFGPFDSVSAAMGALNHFMSLFPEEGLDLDPEQVREERIIGNVFHDETHF